MWAAEVEAAAAEMPRTSRPILNCDIQDGAKNEGIREESAKKRQKQIEKRMNGGSQLKK